MFHKSGENKSLFYSPLIIVNVMLLFFIHLLYTSSLSSPGENKSLFYSPLIIIFLAIVGVFVTLIILLVLVNKWKKHNSAANNVSAASTNTTKKGGRGATDDPLDPGNTQDPDGKNTTGQQDPQKTKPKKKEVKIANGTKDRIGLKEEPGTDVSTFKDALLGRHSEGFLPNGSAGQYSSLGKTLPPSSASTLGPSTNTSPSAIPPSSSTTVLRSCLVNPTTSTNLASSTLPRQQHQQQHYPQQQQQQQYPQHQQQQQQQQQQHHQSSRITSSSYPSPTHLLHSPLSTTTPASTTTTPTTIHHEPAGVGGNDCYSRYSETLPRNHGRGTRELDEYRSDAYRDTGGGGGGDGVIYRRRGSVSMDMDTYGEDYLDDIGGGCGRGYRGSGMFMDRGYSDEYRSGGDGSSYSDGGGVVEGYCGGGGMGVVVGGGGGRGRALADLYRSGVKESSYQLGSGGDPYHAGSGLLMDRGGARGSGVLMDRGNVTSRGVAGVVMERGSGGVGAGVVGGNQEKYHMLQDLKNNPKYVVRTRACDPNDESFV
ncbi:hypothetical protein Pmani_033535 [Petrolisthes manimaculis]|uniref:Uncharacterized protein n=1 Tax=Petrolisthes manimaculis TaxID=1843537 RepID=A0AAE1NQU3_9EUCA|nr:hypothetical protein Pmani_033535 [Petrolisthes manimaculis]